MSSFGVVLDANVLLQAAPRDMLLRAAAEELYRPYWSDTILDEVRRNLPGIIKRHPTPALAAQHLIDELRAHFPEAIVRGFEPLIGCMTNDVGDRHVLAAAVVAKAQVIVTTNLRHFPAAALELYAVEAQSLNTFLTHLFDLAPNTIIRILTEQGADLTPPKTPEQVLDSLRPHAGAFANMVHERLLRPKG